MELFKTRRTLTFQQTLKRLTFQNQNLNQRSQKSLMLKRCKL